MIEQGWSYCDYLVNDAEFVVASLQRSWEGVGTDSEQAAMWYAVNLVDDCGPAFNTPDEPEHDIHRLIGLQPTAETRYEAEAALATLVRFDVTMEPYRLAWDRIVGKYRGEGGIEVVSRLVREHEPAAVKAWHDWLWQPGVSATDHGEASVFAVASKRLAHSLSGILSLESQAEEASTDEEPIRK